ncbi:S9 family peptidase [Pleomorphovibrio marinus]|uniref:S9 family peptidase n=1 Tax=Pleomorphovibrio marinus TaxID=2164132 RepID=UPI000E09E874|nr:prolyl oligopeptidase family serine peptidase [Pleomorphovibrio marinus]
MQLRSFFSLLVFLILFIGITVAQDKSSLKHGDYDNWESFGRTVLTPNGEFVGAEINLQDGDGRVEIYRHNEPNPIYILPRGEDLRFTSKGNYAVGRIKVQKDSLRQLKLKKTKSSEMPQDSLFILNLASGHLTKFPKLKSFKIPEEGENWVAMELDQAEKTEGSGEEKKKTPKLRVWALDGNREFRVEKVKRYGFDHPGNRMYFFRENRDSIRRESVWMLNLENGEEELVHEEAMQYRHPVFSEDGTMFAFVGSNDSAEAKKPSFHLFLQNEKGEKAEKLLASNESSFADGYRLSQYMTPEFSKEGNRLFFGVTKEYKTFAYEEDSTILEEERVSLDIWGWQDKTLQPMQLKQKEDEKRKSYWGLMDMETRRVTQIHDENFRELTLDKERKLNVGLLQDDKSYKRNYSWNIQIGKDVYLVDLESGEKKLVEKNLVGNPTLSPAGKFVVWYSRPDSTYFSYNIETGKKVDLTSKLKVNFFDEFHDSPSYPGPYGPVHWLEQDKALLVYDRFDIWRLDPNGEKSPLNLTRGEGRKKKHVFRVEALDKSVDYIDSSGSLYLNVFGERSKKAGYAKVDWKGNKRVEMLIFEDAWFSGFSKADSSERVIYTKSTFEESPTLYASDLGLKEELSLAKTNPQQGERLWGTVELLDFRANDGSELQGMLYKPENFDPSQKYPMLVYFYERRSDNLHRYISPAPSASTINIPYFVSNGYLVFVPDIKYDLGLPGPSAYNCIVPGVQKVLAEGYVDVDRIGIQGQSWGGYQVAYLITQTDMFRAAGAGAPVANMTSAYGGIRWETGMSRMFQYEQTQSRIGGTLWEKPMHYLENSPLFYADRVSTPVLIMHNDADGAVPWYQGIEFFMALKRNDVPSWLLVYNDEAHNLRKRKNRKDLSIRLSQFFDHYLKDSPAPLWMTEGLPAVEKGRTLKYELEDIQE